MTPQKMFFGGREKDHLGNDLNGKLSTWKRPFISAGGSAQGLIEAFVSKYFVLDI